MSEPLQKQWLTREEVAALLGVNVDLVSRMYHSGQLKGLKAGREFRFHIDDLNALRQYRAPRHKGRGHSSPTHDGRRTSCSHSLSGSTTPNNS
jgi:excisionase family DNA binding protein